MIYLSGHAHASITGRRDLGFMLTRRAGSRPDLAGTFWGADTGCYADPESYSDDAYLAWLATMEPWRLHCLFATAPDVWGDGRATLELAEPMLARLRFQGFPAALVFQPGIEHERIPWNRFDSVFVGGPDEWRFTEPVYALVSEARRRNKWCHLGRCNSSSRLVTAAAGYDSADGTFLAFGPETNWKRMETWLRNLAGQPSLLPLVEPEPCLTCGSATCECDPAYQDMARVLDTYGLWYEEEAEA